MNMEELTPFPTILDTAKQLVYGERNKAYGHPKDNFNNIAGLWNSYLAIKLKDVPDILKIESINHLNNVDIACLNILQKIARLATNPTHRDSINN
jgi:hypothetical protein